MYYMVNPPLCANLPPRFLHIEPQQNYRIGTVINQLLGGGLNHVLRRQPHPQFLKWYKTFSMNTSYMKYGNVVAVLHGRSI